MNPGVVLVHGYTGVSADLENLTENIRAHYGRTSAINISLPGHKNGMPPPFEWQSFLKSIKAAVAVFRQEKRQIILLGHSTGGSLLLAFVKESGLLPELVVLAGTPPRITPDYSDRWHRQGLNTAKIPLTSIAKMLSLVNRTTAESFEETFPVLILHGEHDDLVPFSETALWRKSCFKGPVRIVTVAASGHNVFRGQGSNFAQDVVLRAISSVIRQVSENDSAALANLKTVEPKLELFLSECSSSCPNLVASPGVQRFMGRNPQLPKFVEHEPITVNVEITTRCNLNCLYCARALGHKKNKDMPLEMFQNLLALLPYTFRINLVGLGEPTLHPQLVEFVEIASSQARKVSLVTNAMALAPALSQELHRAGLDAITFSVDSPHTSELSQVRRGADFNRISKNIEMFLRHSAKAQRIPAAVFSAVSARTVFSLEALADVVADWGVDAWMLSDLNFKCFTEQTVWRNCDEKIIKAIKRTLSRAFSRNLPVLSVRGLEEFGLSYRYRDFLLFAPSVLYKRSDRHAWCLSVWQTLVVDVDGNASICDCLPNYTIGNLFTTPFHEIWNGSTITTHREAMLGERPPEACTICPRF